jgi:hypothetical protein
MLSASLRCRLDAGRTGRRRRISGHHESTSMVFSGAAHDLVGA